MNQALQMTASRCRGMAAPELDRSAMEGDPVADDGHSMRRIGWLALSLFIGGLLLPFALYLLLVSKAVEMPHQRSLNLSAAVGAVCELLALVLGVVGWRHPTGKVAGIGSGVLIGLTLFAMLAFVFR